jgi:hypothetical protein
LTWIKRGENAPPPSHATRGGCERAEEIDRLVLAGLKYTYRANIGSKPIIPLASVFLRFLYGGR